MTPGRRRADLPGGPALRLRLRLLSPGARCWGCGAGTRSCPCCCRQHSKLLWRPGSCRTDSGPAPRDSCVSRPRLPQKAPRGVGRWLPPSESCSSSSDGHPESSLPRSGTGCGPPLQRKGHAWEGGQSVSQLRDVAESLSSQNGASEAFLAPVTCLMSCFLFGLSLADAGGAWIQGHWCPSFL